MSPEAVRLPLLLVGTENGLYEIGPEARVHHEARAVTALAVRGDTWWVILDGGEIQRSRAGTEWDAAKADPPRRALCLLPGAFGLLVGTAEAGLFRLRAGRLEEVESFRKVKGRKAWSTPGGGPPDTRSLAAGGDGTLFANVHVGGIARSRDGGKTWEPTIEVDSDVHQVVVHPTRPEIVLAATAQGLGVSRDGGDSWSFETGGLHAAYQRAVAAAEETVLVSSSKSERGQEAAVYRWRLGSSAPLARCRAGLPEWFSNNVNTGCLAANPELAVIGAPDGTVYVSRDQGKRWATLRRGLPKVTCVAFG